MIGHAGYTQKTGSAGGGHSNHAFHFNFDDLFADFDGFGGGFAGGFSSDFVSEVLLLVCMWCICDEVDGMFSVLS